MFDAILWGGPGGEAPRESRGVWGAARPPNEGDGRGGGTVNGFWVMIPSRGMVKVGLICRSVLEVFWREFGKVRESAVKIWGRFRHGNKSGT